MRTLIGLLLAGPLFAQTQAPALSQVLQDTPVAVGGEAAIRKLVTLSRKGFEPGNGAPAWPVEVYSTASGRWQFIATIPGAGRMEHVSNGPAAWLQGPDGSEDLPEPEVARESQIFDPNAFLRPAAFFGRLTLKGSQGTDAGTVWIVEAQPDKGGPVTLAFSAASGLLTRIGENRLEDFRQVSGLLLPFRIRWREGQSEYLTRFEEMHLNFPIEDARFDRRANTERYRQIVREMTGPELERALLGIDAGPAKAVLEDLHNFTPADGRLLYDLIVQHGYQRGLEIGTAHGNSAVWMGLAFQKNGGKLITIELDSGRAAIATANFHRAGLDRVVTCHNNDAFKEIPLLEGEFDWVFMDTGTNLHKKLLDALYPRVRPGGAIVSHNANDMERYMPDYLKAITTDPNLETRIQHTPGGGVTISLKRPSR